VCSYRYSCYYDPCTCSYKQTATPVTSYQLRAQSCPVQSWVQRGTQVPVTAYQKVSYWQPQTTCCTTTEGTPIMAGGAAAPSVNINVAPTAPPNVNAVPSITNPPAGTPPNVNEQRNFGTGASNPAYERYYPQTQPPGTAPTMPPASWKPQPAATTPAAAPAPRAPQPSVKLESIVLGPDQRVEGQVVRADNSPRPNAKMLFVSAQTGQRFTATANSAGRFHVDLPTGGWLVYLYGPDDLPAYTSRIDVAGRDNAPIKLVSRLH
jgi:hypothetical protein